MGPGRIPGLTRRGVIRSSGGRARRLDRRDRPADSRLALFGNSPSGRSRDRFRQSRAWFRSADQPAPVRSGESGRLSGIRDYALQPCATRSAKALHFRDDPHLTDKKRARWPSICGRQWPKARRNIRRIGFRCRSRCTGREYDVAKHHCRFDRRLASWRGNKKRTPMAASSRLMITEAERRFPCRIKLRVPTGGLGTRLTEMQAWLDENCGADQWVMTPAGLRGVVNDAVAIYFLDAARAAAFVTRWCVGSQVEISDGAFQVREDRPTPRIGASPHKTP